jgi:hypothetical protein
MSLMAWAVETLDQFDDWYLGLSESEQTSVRACWRLLGERGPTLGHPHTSDIKGSKHGNMRELRVQSGGKPLRVLYAFDPTRTAILILGGDKTGDDRWYEVNVPKADKLYDTHLAELNPPTKGKRGPKGRKAPK